MVVLKEWLTGAVGGLKAAQLDSQSNTNLGDYNTRKNYWCYCRVCGWCSGSWNQNSRLEVPDH
jgi:hypothetical protein